MWNVIWINNKAQTIVIESKFPIVAVVNKVSRKE